ncbi:MAG: glycosyltransferase family 2 protein, partial [Roseicyclus sp.]
RRTVGYDWAQMNHYAVKSVEAYAVRKFRGNVNNKKDKYNADYWALQDRNEVEDRAILRHAPERARIMETLLADPVLSALHEAALGRVEARLADFRKTPEFAALRDALLEASRVPITKVEAKPPQARDPGKIAALMSRVERKASERPKAERRSPPPPGWATEDGDPYLPGGIDLSAPLAVDWTENHGIPLPADPRIFAAEALNAVVTGRFERRHARNIAAYLDGHTRLLEVGAGLGFLPLRALSLMPDLAAMAQEGRPALRAQAREVAARAGEAGARLEVSDTDAATLLEAFRPTALRLARPAALPPDTIAALDLAPVSRILLPFATEAQAARLRVDYGPALAHAGFVEDEARAAGGTLQFDRREG